jgi:hypothetical protein
MRLLQDRGRVGPLICTAVVEIEIACPDLVLLVLESLR